MKTIASYLHRRKFQTSFQSGTTTRRSMRAGVVQGGLVSSALFSLYVNATPAPSRHVWLAQYADDTALIATIALRQLFGDIEKFEHRLRDWRILINVSKSTAVLPSESARRIQKPISVQFVGQPIQWVKTAWYLAVVVATRQPGRIKGSSKTGRAWPLLNRNGLSIRNGVLLYKQLTQPMMDEACWSAASRHAGKLQVLQSKRFRIATNAPRYVSYKQIHMDFGITFFADHIRALTESFDRKLADPGNPLVWQIGRNLCLPRAVWSHRLVTEEDWCSTGQSRLPLKRRPSRRNK
jgi:hypothetical protein